MPIRPVPRMHLLTRNKMFEGTGSDKNKTEPPISNLRKTTSMEDRVSRQQPSDQRIGRRSTLQASGNDASSLNLPDKIETQGNIRNLIDVAFVSHDVNKRKNTHPLVFLSRRHQNRETDRLLSYQALPSFIEAFHLQSLS